MIDGLTRAARRRPIRSAALLVAGVVVVAAGTALWRRTSPDAAMTAVARRGTVTAQLTATGILGPAQSITYRSPLGGREAEVTFLVAEGTRVNEGDLLVRLDTTELQREVERATQEWRQAQVDVQVADIERQESQTALDSLSEGEGALSVEETRTRLQLAEKKVARLREEHDTLKPLLDKGFITREELRKTADELEQAEQDLALARRRTEVLVERTHPRDRQRASLQLAQREAQRENVRARLNEAAARVKLLRDQVENCSIYARRPGLVVFEEYLAANPRRKIRVGDRVTGSQGLLTIPEVDRMLVEASVSEADVHRVQPGQRAAIFLEAFPGLRLTGHVTRVGTLARSSAERPFDDKRFDLVVEVDPSGADLRPEMTARVDVVLGERQGVLLLPVNAVFERQGVTVCHVVRPFGVETVPVQLGESNDLVVEVTSGVNEGDRVSLVDVASAMKPEGAAPGNAASRWLRQPARQGSGVLQPR
jgi:HlyD family secretion protein